jgi:hypothetical protein
MKTEARWRPWSDEKCRRVRYTTTRDLTCTPGKRPELKLFFCTFRFPEQTNPAHVVFENINPGAGKEDETNTKHIYASFTVSGMHYIASSGPNCGPPPFKEHTDGSLSAKFTIKAYQATSLTQVTKQGHQYNEYTTGTQVGIFMT